jgi:hypothetical protein
MTTAVAAMLVAAYQPVITPCYYCGLPAGSIDHVVPRSVIEMLGILQDPAVTGYMHDRHRVKTVPACLECNDLIGPKYFPTLAERRAYLKDRLRVRYRKFLELPNWSDSELAQLSDRLQKRVIGALEVQRIVQARIAWT